MVATHVNGTTSIRSTPTRARRLLYVCATTGISTGRNVGCAASAMRSLTVMGAAIVYSCDTPIIALENRSITHARGASARLRKIPRRLAAGLMESEAAQCGYCSPGIISERHALRDNVRDLPTGHPPTTCSPSLAAAANPYSHSCAPCSVPSLSNEIMPRCRRQQGNRADTATVASCRQHLSRLALAARRAAADRIFSLPPACGSLSVRRIAEPGSRAVASRRPCPEASGPVRCCDSGF